MSKVYLIMVGEYSDKQCVGYCTSQEEAEKYCAVKNSTSGAWDYLDTYYVEEAKCLDRAVNNHPTLGRAVRMQLSMSGDLLYKENYISCRVAPDVSEYGKDTVFVRVWQKEVDYDLALKAARDLLAKWKAARVESQHEAKDKLKQLEHYLTK